MDAREPQENQELFLVTEERLVVLDDEVDAPEGVSGENKKCSYKPTSMDMKEAPSRGATVVEVLLEMEMSLSLSEACASISSTGRGLFVCGESMVKAVSRWNISSRENMVSVKAAVGRTLGMALSRGAGGVG